MIKKTQNGQLKAMISKSAKPKQKIDFMKAQILEKVCSYLTLVEIEELCLVSKTMREKVYSISRVKIRILEEKVQNTQGKLKVKSLLKIYNSCV